VSVLHAHYFDGKTSRKHTVSVVLSGAKLKIVGRDVNEVFDARRVRRSLRIGNTPRWLYLPGGGACVTADNDAVDRITRKRRYERILHRWESRPAYAALAVGLVVAALWLLIDRGLPVAVDYVAERIPVEAEAMLGRETLEGMERFALKPSKLSSARQQALRAKFDAMARTARETTPYRLEFRSSPIIGANAFALPSGIIVMTDELVRAARNDQEVLGVLAHELGHVRHRHTMRRLLESSATALIIAGVTGDIASTTSLAAAAPALLLQTKYSRDNEREADRYAIELMRKAGLQPRYLGSILARLEGDAPRRGAFPSFLATHPSTEEREALALAGAGVTPELEQAGGEEPDKPVPERLKLVAVDPVQRQVIDLLEERRYAELERLLGGRQLAFEQDPGTSAQLENAFAALRKVPRSGEPALNEWAAGAPASYAAALARGSFYLSQGMDARGGGYFRDTPEENIRTMHAYLDKARADLERSLTLAQKPYLSRLALMTIARNSGNRASEKTHYQEGLKIAPQSVELRLARMASLEPRWGGSYAEMQALVAEARAQLSDPRAADRVAARVPAYRAFERQSAKDFAQALKHYDEAIALDANAGVLCDRSYALSQLKRDAEAFADVKAALSKSRDNRYCLERAVYQATKEKEAGEAIQVLNLVIEVDPNAPLAFNQRGWRYQQTGKTDLAFQDYLASAKLGDPWAQMQVGKFYWSGIGTKQDREEGLGWLRKAAAQGDRDAKLSLEQALEQLGKK
jgi:Zn-dependent protease with chaperone function/TPR repeat protein